MVRIRTWRRNHVPYLALLDLVPALRKVLDDVEDDLARQDDRLAKVNVVVEGRRGERLESRLACKVVVGGEESRDSVTLEGSDLELAVFVERLVDGF